MWYSKGFWKYSQTIKLKWKLVSQDMELTHTHSDQVLSFYYPLMFDGHFVCFNFHLWHLMSAASQLLTHGNHVNAISSSILNCGHSMAVTWSHDQLLRRLKNVWFPFLTFRRKKNEWWIKFFPKRWVGEEVWSNGRYSSQGYSMGYNP